jgi:kynurenine formamidase
MSPDGLLRAGTWGSRFVDLSHELADGMAPYPGLPTPRIGPHLDHAASRAHYDGEEFFLGKVDMPTNIGTYVDAPFHRFPGQDDLSQIPLERLAGVEGVVVDATQQPSRGCLLGAGVLIVEHLCNLGDLPQRGFRFFAPVVRVRQGASFPVRAFAELEG